MLTKFVFLWIVFVATPALAQVPQDSIGSSKNNAAHQTHLVLPDILVRDSENREYRLMELLRDRIAVVNFVFTSCTTVCPVLSATMQHIERQLQDRLGKEVVLVSVSVDPARDTPERLRAHAEKLGSGAHWHWLTGRPPEFNRLLKAFAIPTGRPEDHPPVILIGNASTGNWLRWVGIAPPESLVEAVTMLGKDNL